MSTLLLAVLSVAAVGTWGTSVRAIRRRQLVARRLSLLDEEIDLAGSRLEGIRSAWRDGLTRLQRGLVASFSRADRRRREIARSVSPVLDRIVCRMHAGMSFESAVGATVREHPRRHRALKAELLVYLQETRIGHSPREALLCLSRRCGVPELDRVVGALLMGRDPVTQRGQLLACALALHARRERWDGAVGWHWAIVFFFYLSALILVWTAR